MPRLNPYSENEVLELVIKLEEAMLKNQKIELTFDDIRMICERLRTLLNMEQYVAILKKKIAKLERV